MRGMGEEKRRRFTRLVCEGSWTLMMEYNDSGHEHVFPIEHDFVRVWGPRSPSPLSSFVQFLPAQP